MVRVSTWAEKGLKPDLNPGRWVQVGPPTRWNFFKTGLQGGKFKFKKEFPWLSRRPSNVPFENGITKMVEQSKLMFPKGFDVIKAILGQRRIK